ncbi:MAG: type IV pilus assembly protein PilM [Pseudobdellovibrionaceae bacterium]
MFFKSKRLIGLDIGSSSIKIAEVEHGRNGAELLSFGMAPTPPGAVSGGEILDVASVSTTIRVLLSELRTNRKNICTGMWGTAVIVKKITIPKIDKKLIKDQIRFEAEQYIPFDSNNINLAYNVLPSSSSQDTMDLVLIAAQNELIRQYTQAVESAGYNCSVIDVSGFGLANNFELNYRKYTNEAIGLLNFGASVTNFVVLDKGEVIFCRDIPVGGANYTNEIHKSLGITLHEAESLKLSAVLKKEVPDEVHSIISATNETITEEVKGSVDFLMASNAGVNLNRCFFTGGSSATPGLVQNISQSLGVNLESFNPFQKIKVSPKKFSPQYLAQIAPFAGVVLGLALRKMGDS